MKKQVLSVFTLVITLFLVGINPLHAQSNGDPYGRGDKDGIDGGGQCSDCVSGKCFDDDVSTITVSQDFDKFKPVFPTSMTIHVVYALKDAPQTYLSKSFDYPQFTYDSFDFANGKATKIVESTVVHCDDYAGNAHDNYEFYQMTVNSTFASGHTTHSTVIVIEDGARVNQMVTPGAVLVSYTAYPNPFQNELNISYTLSATTTSNIQIALVNQYNQVLMSTTDEQVKGTFTHQFNTTTVPVGSYVLKIMVTNGNTTEMETIQVIKQSGGGFGGPGGWTKQ